MVAPGGVGMVIAFISVAFEGMRLGLARGTFELLDIAPTGVR